MKLAMNGATTMRADLKTDIESASAAGFELIEIWAAKMREFLKTNTVADLKHLLEANNLEPYSINSIEHITFRNAEDYEKIKAETEEYSRIAGEINCPYVVVVPGKMPENADENQIIEESVKVLNELADIAEKHGVGLVIDTFHFYAGNSTFEAIETLDPKKLFIFHINDAEDLPKADLTDAHRLYPGLGILPIREIKKKFDKIGYDRMVSIEIFRPEYWAQDPFEVTRQAKAATEKVLGLTPKTANV